MTIMLHFLSPKLVIACTNWLGVWDQWKQHYTYSYSLRPSWQRALRIPFQTPVPSDLILHCHCQCHHPNAQSLSPSFDTASHPKHQPASSPHKSSSQLVSSALGKWQANCAIIVAHFSVCQLVVVGKCISLFKKSKCKCTVLVYSLSLYQYQLYVYYNCH